MEKYNLLVSTYSDNGIHKLSFENGHLTHILSDNTFKDCSFLCKYNDSVFHVVEGPSIESSFIVSRNADLSVINSLNSNGISPCYICVDKLRNLLYVANYVSGSFGVFSLTSSGVLNKLIFSKTFTESSNIHCVELSSDSNFLFITDLGGNKLFAYKIIFENGLFNLELVSEYTFTDNAHPRHFVVNDNNIFLVTEASCELYRFSFSAANGIQFVEKLSLLPEDAENLENYTGCAISLSKDKKYIYVSVRGLDIICVFSVSPTLKLVQQISCHGASPRALFLLDNYLLCANQVSNSISIFDINKNTGKLSLNNTFNIEHPACIINL